MILLGTVAGFFGIVGAAFLIIIFAIPMVGALFVRWEAACERFSKQPEERDVPIRMLHEVQEQRDEARAEVDRLRAQLAGRGGFRGDA